MRNEECGIKNPKPTIQAHAQSIVKASRAWLGRGTNLLFLALVILALAPLTAFEYFPSQDGPNHLYSAGVLLRYRDAPQYQRFYTLNPRPNPNWLSQAALTGLLTLAPPATAEKILIGAILALLALGMRHALGAVRPGATGLAVLVFPFLYNWPLHMGFYNFGLSLAVMLFTLGFWIRHQAAPRLRHGAGLAALLIVLYFCHLVTLVMTLLALGVLAAWLPFYDWLAERTGTSAVPGNSFRIPHSAFHISWARLAFTLGPALPVLALAAAFLHRTAGAGDVSAPFRLYFHPRKFLYLFDLETTLFTFRVNELVFGAILIAGLAAVTLAALAWRLRQHRLRRWDGLALVGLVWLAAFLLAPPNGGKGTYLYHRMVIFVDFALILWLGVGRLPRPARLGAQALAGGLALILMLFYTLRYAEAQPALEEVMSAAPAVAPGSVILPVCLTPRGMLPDGRPYAVRTQPFIHVASLVALARGAVDLSDYEGRTEHFPTHFRPELNPECHGLGEEAPDPERYERATGVRIDAVLVIQDAGHTLAAPERQALARWLEREFKPVFVSRPGGMATVFRRRGGD